MGAVSEADARSTQASFARKVARGPSSGKPLQATRWEGSGIGCRRNRTHPAASPKDATRSFPG
ncbi:MAG: hypothetical protein Kow0092_33210 [Deferrisomatales bacterium]